MGMLDRLIQRAPEVSTPQADDTTLRRLASLPDAELAIWIDNTAAALGRDASKGFRAERVEEQAAYFAEAEISAEAALHMVREIRKRRNLH